MILYASVCKIAIVMIQKTSQSYKHHLVAFIIAPLLKIFEAIFDLLIPLFMKAVIDLAIYSKPENITNPLSQALAYFIRLFGTWIPDNLPLSDALVGGTIILVMGIVGFGLTMITQYVAAKTAMDVGTEIRDSLFRKIMSFSRREKNKCGNNKLLTVLNSDSYLVQQGVLIFIRLIVRAPFIILGALVISFILDYRVGFVFLAIIPLIVLIIFIVMRKSSKEYLSIQEKLDVLSSHTTDTIEGTKLIRGFDKVDEEIKYFEKKVNAYKNRAVYVSKINSLINPLTFAVISIASILVVVFVGLNIINITNNSEAVLLATTIITEIAYLTQIFVTLMQLSNVILILTKARASRKRVDEILSIEPSIINNNSSSSETTSVIVEFKNVSLSYVEGGNNALTGISFSLPKGGSLGIIGGTGSGKSSIASLVDRFIDASSGEVIYKGSNIKDYSLSLLRNEIGYVPQKAVLFKGSIRSNLLMGNLNASDEMMKQALKDACAYDFVSKYEDGLDHAVEEKGLNYSGGQRQRLSIARALLKNPELLILDDSTSALDLLTDKAVRENIKNNYQNITKIIISQRVSTIKDLDEIIVLSYGKVVGKGKHSYLLKHCKEYKEIYDSQVTKGDSL